MSTVEHVPFVRVTVDGDPATKGSLKFVTSKSTGKPIAKITGSRNLGFWVQRIATEMQDAMDGQPLTDDALYASFVFSLQKPKSKAKREHFPKWKPDPDKLARAAMDALKGIVYTDDARGCVLHVEKWYAGDVNGAEKPGVEVTIERLVYVE